MRLLVSARTTMDELDDLTLARAQRGDAAAFRELVSRHAQPVFACLWRMLGGRGERALVEDLAQETFEKVHRALPRFHPGGPARLGTWILTIATRTALNELRRPAPARAPLDDTLPGVPAADHALALTVRQALERMTADHRAVLVLREYHQLDYQEIAAALEIDVGTVRSRLSRARAALRAALEEEMP